MITTILIVLAVALLWPGHVSVAAAERGEAETGTGFQYELEYLPLWLVLYRSVRK